MPDQVRALTANQKTKKPIKSNFINIHEKEEAVVQNTLRLFGVAIIQ